MTFNLFLKLFLNHRIGLHAEREMEGITEEDVIRQIIKNIEVPR